MYVLSGGFGKRVLGWLGRRDENLGRGGKGGNEKWVMWGWVWLHRIFIIRLISLGHDHESEKRQKHIQCRDHNFIFALIVRLP